MKSASGAKKFKFHFWKQATKIQAGTVKCIDIYFLWNIAAESFKKNPDRHLNTVKNLALKYFRKWGLGS